MPSWFRRLRNRVDPANAAATQDNAPAEGISEADGQASGYQTDRPVEFRRDRFRRAPFARRFADTILARRDPASLVLSMLAEVWLGSHAASAKNDGGTGCGVRVAKQRRAVAV